MPTDTINVIELKRTRAVAIATMPSTLKAIATVSQRLGRGVAVSLRAEVEPSVTTRLLLRRLRLRMRRHVAVAADTRFLAARDRVGIAHVRRLLLVFLHRPVTEEAALVVVGSPNLDRLLPADEVVRPEVA